MKFYEVISNDYSNEIIARSDLHDHLCILWPFVKVKYKPHLETVYNFSCLQNQPIQQFSPSARLHCIDQGHYTSPKIAVQRSKVR